MNHHIYLSLCLTGNNCRLISSHNNLNSSICQTKLPMIIWHSIEIQVTFLTKEVKCIELIIKSKLIISYHIYMYILFITYKLANNNKKMRAGKNGAGRWLGNYKRDWGHSNAIEKKILYFIKNYLNNNKRTA